MTASPAGNRASLRLRVAAKVNLFLRVVGRRPDGYHELESVFQSVSLYDALTLRGVAGELRLFCDAPGVPADETNLVLRAARALRGDVGTSERWYVGTLPGAELTLAKEIPSGAGLGGGSADAAAALVGLNRLWGLGLPEERLAELAAEIGSDVPFFLKGGACLARGRGELLEPLPLPAPWWLVLVKPPFSVATADAYRAWRPEPGSQVAGCRLQVGTDERSPTLADFLAAWRAADLPGVARALRNDLEPGVTERHPEIAALRESLLAAGALGARMTGSGSVVFGLVETEAEARRVAEAVPPEAGRAFVARFLTPAEALV